jgi:hypothetical protein
MTRATSILARRMGAGSYITTGNLHRKVGSTVSYRNAQIPAHHSPIGMDHIVAAMVEAKDEHATREPTGVHPGTHWLRDSHRLGPAVSLASSTGLLKLQLAMPCGVVECKFFLFGHE